MSKAPDYAAKIRQLTATAALVSMWRAIGVRATPGWPRGKAFEYLILRAFEIEGAVVRYPYSVQGDTGIIEQIDGAIHLPNQSFLVESKDFHKTKTNIEPLAKLRLRLERRPHGVMGVIFSRQGLTDAALEVGIPRGILLWQGGEIEAALRNSKMIVGLGIKVVHAVEEGVQDYNLLTEGWP